MAISTMAIITLSSRPRHNIIHGSANKAQAAQRQVEDEKWINGNSNAILDNTRPA